jgi:hypothetical protein
MSEIQEAYAEVRWRQEAAARANGDPLPGPLSAAFGPAWTAVGNLKVRRPVASDWVILKALNSPAYQFALEVSQNPEKPQQPELTRQDEAEICWQFTHSPKENRELLAKGVEAFKAKASDEISDNWTDEEVKLVWAVVMIKLGESRQTALKFAQEMEGKGDERFFRVSAATSPPTAGDGSLSTNAVSSDLIRG